MLMWLSHHLSMLMWFPCGGCGYFVAVGFLVVVLLSCLVGSNTCIQFGEYYMYVVICCWRCCLVVAVVVLSCHYMFVHVVVVVILLLIVFFMFSYCCVAVGVCSYGWCCCYLIVVGVCAHCFVVIFRMIFSKRKTKRNHE